MLGRGSRDLEAAGTREVDTPTKRSHGMARAHRRAGVYEIRVEAAAAKAADLGERRLGHILTCRRNACLRFETGGSPRGKGCNRFRASQVGDTSIGLHGA
jgi:hypothetical protein